MLATILSMLLLAQPAAASPSAPAPVTPPATARPADAASLDDATVEELVVTAGRPLPPLSAGDAQLAASWNALADLEPDRVVCMRLPTATSRIRRPVCGSLRQWYAIQDKREAKLVALFGPDDPTVGRGRRPPVELMSLIKDAQRNPAKRKRAEARALERAGGPAVEGGPAAPAAPRP